MKYASGISTLMLVLLTYIGSACGLCNCYLSLEPGYNETSVGVRMRHESFSGSHEQGHVHEGEMQEADIHEQFNTYELAARLYPFSKLQVLATLPIADNYHTVDGTKSERISGVGDFTLMGFYQVYNTFPNEKEIVRHRIFAGAGVKLPTGKYDIVTDGELDELHQPGTGSTDVLTGVNYLAKYKKSGLHLYATYKYNTSNENEYHFADRFNVNCDYLYEFKKKDFSFYPKAGVYFETAGMDESHGMEVEDSGGQVFFTNIGLDVFYKKLSLNLNGQIPVYQNLYGEQSANQYRFVVGLNYTFN